MPCPVSFRLIYPLSSVTAARLLPHRPNKLPRKSTALAFTFFKERCLNSKENYRLIKNLLNTFDGASIRPVKTKKPRIERILEEAKTGKNNRTLSFDRGTNERPSKLMSTPVPIPTYSAKPEYS